MKYRVSVNGHAYEVEVQGTRVVVDGVEHEAELRTVAGTPLRLLVLDGRSWALPVEAAGRGRWILHQWGERFELEVLDERASHIRSLVGTGKAHDGLALVRAPMPGLVVRVLVTPGQEVAAGDGLIVLEAMKMENELKAAGPGVVERVEVTPGQAVERGAPLVAFREPSTPSAGPASDLT